MSKEVKKTEKDDEKVEDDIAVWKSRSLTLQRMLDNKDEQCRSALALLESRSRDAKIWACATQALVNYTGLTLHWCPGCGKARVATEEKTEEHRHVLGKLCPACLSTIENPWEK